MVSDPIVSSIWVFVDTLLKAKFHEEEEAAYYIYKAFIRRVF
jgi:hypothetical protein